MRKICFLDIDGVLNSSETELYYGGYGGFFNENEAATEQNVRWGQELVDNLKYIIKETQAEIVVSSTWRQYFSVNKFKEMFKVYGWDDAPVIDRTDFSIKDAFSNRVYKRGKEIEKWIKENNPDSFVILDDWDQFLLEQKSNFINTNPQIGLSYDDAIKAIEILLKKSSENPILES